MKPRNPATAKTAGAVPKPTVQQTLALAAKTNPDIYPAVVTHTGSPRDPIPVAQLVAAGIAKGDIIQGIQNAENQKPIEAYGKVIDQHGDPVVGASVDGNALLNAGANTSRYETHTTVTDSNGRFEFTGLHGINLGISIKKEGYETNNKGFRSAEGKPDTDNRDTYIMWKLNGAEPTIADDKFWGIIPDGRAYTIDFITSKKVENSVAEGDLRVTISRPTDAKRGQKFDWSFTMESVDGGIVESHDAYPYEAPEGGYQNKIEVTMSATDPKWQPEVQGRIFYIRSRGGQVYGHFQIDVVSVYQAAAAFSIRSLVNPAGSRNLELDETKSVKAGSPRAQLISSSASQ